MAVNLEAIEALTNAPKIKHGTINKVGETNQLMPWERAAPKADVGTAAVPTMPPTARPRAGAKEKARTKVVKEAREMERMGGPKEERVKEEEELEAQREGVGIAEALTMDPIVPPRAKGPGKVVAFQHTR